MISRTPPIAAKSDRREPPRTDNDDPPLRLAHVLFVLWVAGSVGWAIYAATVGSDLNWWVQSPELAALLVLAVPILTHLLAILLVRVTGNPVVQYSSPMRLRDRPKASGAQPLTEHPFQGKEE